MNQSIISRLLLCLLVLVLGATDVLSQIQFGPGNQTASYTAGRVRGYYFTAPANFNICQLYVPNTMNNNMWHVEVVKFNNATAPPAFPGTTNAFVSLFYADSVTGTNPISTNIPVNSGDVIGIYGSRSTTNGSIMANSYNGTQPTTSILGNNVTLYRSGMQFPLNNQQMHDIWAEIQFNTARVFGFYGCCPTPAAPQGPIVGPDTVCIGDTVTYTIPWDSGAVSYTWTVPVGDTIISVQNDTVMTMVVGPNAVNDSICVALDDSCTTSPTLCFGRVIAQPAVTGAVSGSAIICQGNSSWYSVPSSPSFTGYSWSVPPGATILSNQDSNAILVQLGATSGSVCVNVTDSCATSEDTCMSVTVNLLPSVANAGSDQTRCSGLAVNLQGNTPVVGNGTWTILSEPAGNAATFSNPNSGTSQYQNFSTGAHTLVWTIASSGCPSSSDTMIVLASVTPTAEFAVQNVCEGAAVTFQDQSSGNGQTITAWNWDMENDGVDNYIIQNPSHLYSAPGTYTVRLIVNSFGCADTLFKDVWVNPRPEIDISAPNVCDEKTVQINRNNSILLGGIASETYTFGDGSGAFTYNPPTNNVNHLYDGPGLYNIICTAVSDSGCSSTGNASVRVYANPVPDFSISNSCQYQATIFRDQSSVKGNKIDTRAWYMGDGSDSVFTRNVKHTFTVNGLVPVYLEVKSEQGCKSDTTIVFEVNPTPEPQFNYTNKVCLGDTMLLEDKSTIDYGSIDRFEWAISDSFMYSGQSAIHLFDSIGWYTVLLEVESDEGCVASIEKEVPVYEIPIADFTYESKCSEYPIQFRNATSFSGALAKVNWDFGDTTGTANEDNPVYTFAEHGSYDVEMYVESFKGCSAIVVKPVRVFEKPTVDFSMEPDSGCSPLSMEVVNGSFTETNRSFTESWDFGDGGVAGDTTEYLYTNYSGKPKYYPVTLRITTDEGCFAELTRDSFVFVLPQPIAKFETLPDGGITTKSPVVQFSNLSRDGNKWSWDFGDGNESVELNPVHEYTTAGSYTSLLRIRNIHNCWDSASKEIVMSHENVLFVPKAFTPNGDGVNDFFEINGLENYTELKLFIYDRWGQVIFSENNLNARWNGKDFQGMVVPLGVYLYKIEYTLENGDVEEVLGDVTVIGLR